MNVQPKLSEPSSFPPPPPQFCNTPKISTKNPSHSLSSSSVDDCRNARNSLLILSPHSNDKFNPFLHSSSTEISSLGAVCEIETNDCSATFRTQQKSVVLLDPSSRVAEAGTMPSQNARALASHNRLPAAAESQLLKNPVTSKPSSACSDSSDSDRSLQDSGIFTSETLATSPEPPSGANGLSTDEAKVALALSRERKSTDVKMQSITQVSQSGVMTITISNAPGNYDAKSIVLSSSTNGYGNAKAKKDSTSATSPVKSISKHDQHSNESCNSNSSSVSSLDSIKTVTDSKNIGKMTIHNGDESTQDKHQESKVFPNSSSVKDEPGSPKKVFQQKSSVLSPIETISKPAKMSTSNAVLKDTSVTSLPTPDESCTNFASVMSNLSGHSKEGNFTSFSEANGDPSTSPGKKTKVSKNLVLSGHTPMNYDPKNKMDSSPTVSPTSSMSLNSSSSSLVSSSSSTTPLIPKDAPRETAVVKSTTPVKGRLVKKSKSKPHEWLEDVETPCHRASPASTLQHRSENISKVKEKNSESRGPSLQMEPDSIDDETLRNIGRPVKSGHQYDSTCHSGGGTCSDGIDKYVNCGTFALSHSTGYHTKETRYSGSAPEVLPTRGFIEDVYANECVAPPYQRPEDVTKDGVAIMDPHADPVSHPATDPPSCSACVRKGQPLFNIQCDGCWTFLKKGHLSASHVFAVLRQWDPRVQLNIGPLVGLAVKGGSGINDRDAATDMTLLHYAVKAGARGVGDPCVAVQVVEELLRGGADPHLRCKWTHMTPLHYAAFFDVPLVIDLLMEDPEGVPPDDPCPEYDGAAPLHLAASNLCVGAARSLLRHGASPRVRDAKGRTPADCLPNPDQYPQVPDVLNTIRDLQHLLVDISDGEAGRNPSLYGGELESPPGGGGKAVLQAMGLKLGDRVLVNGTLTGVLRYAGTTEFAVGLWGGVELDAPGVGGHDGAVRGLVYFRCPPGCGIFVPLLRLAKIPHVSRGRGQVRGTGPCRGRSVAPSRTQDNVSRESSSHRAIEADGCGRRSLSLPPGRVNRGRVDVSKVGSRVAMDISDDTRKISIGERVLVDLRVTPGQSGMASLTSLFSNPKRRRRRSHGYSSFEMSRNGNTTNNPQRRQHGGSSLEINCNGHTPGAKRYSGSAYDVNITESDVGINRNGKPFHHSSESILKCSDPGFQMHRWVAYGTVKFVGTVAFASGFWVGIELDEAIGSTDGTVNGVAYFQGRPKHGVFAAASRVAKIREGESSNEYHLPGLIYHQPSRSNQNRNDSSKTKCTSRSSSTSSGPADICQAELVSFHGRRIPKTYSYPGECSKSSKSVENSSADIKRRNSTRKPASPGKENTSPRHHNFTPGNTESSSTRSTRKKPPQVPKNSPVLEVDKVAEKKSNLYTSWLRYMSEASDGRTSVALPILLPDLTCSRALYPPNTSMSHLNKSFSARYVSSRLRQEELQKQKEEEAKEPQWHERIENKPSVRYNPQYYGRETFDNHWVDVGCNVFYKGCIGTVKYIGPVDFDVGTWLGIELRKPLGRHDGVVLGRRYFSCRPQHGVVVRPSAVTVRGINGALLVRPEDDGDEDWM